MTTLARNFGLLLVGLMMVALGQLDTSMGRIEVPSQQAFTINGLSDINPFEVPDNATEAWHVWHGLGQADDPKQGDGTGAPAQDESAVAKPARTILTAYTVMDLLFMLSYLTIGWFLLRWLANRLPEGAAASAVDNGLRRATHPGFVAWVFGFIFLGEVAEAISYLILAHSPQAPGEALGLLLGFGSVIKWLALAVAALIVLAAFLRTRDWASQGLWQMIKLLRMQLGIAAVLAVLLTGVGTDQMQDALLAIGDKWSRVFFTVLAMLVLTVLMWRSVHRSALTDDKPWKPIRPWIVALTAVAALVVGWLFAINLVGLGIVLIVVMVLSWLGGASPIGREADTASYEPAMQQASDQAAAVNVTVRERAMICARALAVLPGLVIAVFLVRSSIVTFLLGPESGKALLVLVLGVIMGFAAVAVPFVLETLDKLIDRRNNRLGRSVDKGDRHLLYICFAVLSLVGVMFAWIAEFDFPVLLGPAAVVGLFLAVVLILGTELQRWAEYSAPVAGFRVLGLKRTPVFMVVLAWFLASSFVDTQGHHGVRTTDTQSPQPMELRDAFTAWQHANCADKESADKEPVKLVIVSASGGGVRAAYWSAGALHKMFPRQNIECQAPVFAASGVSGGSLGIASWLSLKPGESVEQVFDQDYLSPTVSWLLHADLPRTFLGYGGPDRAAVLEQSWEREQTSLAQTFYSQWPATAGWTPLALLNGTSVTSGCRLLTAPVRLGAFDKPGEPLACRANPASATEQAYTAPALVDLGEQFMQCGRDINRSTAALLSGRFPYVTPSGRITSCDGEDFVHIVDGGYVEASASLTAYDLYRALKPMVDCHNHAVDQPSTPDCRMTYKPTRPIEPVLVQIDNGYDSVARPDATGRPRELLAPIVGFIAAAATSDSAARQRAFNAVGCDHYVRIANVPTPGTQAPLGLTLSRSAQADLDQQLDSALGKDPTLGAHLAAKRCAK